MKLMLSLSYNIMFGIICLLVSNSLLLILRIVSFPDPVYMIFVFTLPSYFIISSLENVKCVSEFDACSYCLLNKHSELQINFRTVIRKSHRICYWIMSGVITVNQFQVSLVFIASLQIFFSYVLMTLKLFMGCRFVVLTNCFGDCPNRLQTNIFSQNLKS